MTKKATAKHYSSVSYTDAFCSLVDNKLLFITVYQSVAPDTCARGFRVVCFPVSIYRTLQGLGTFCDVAIRIMSAQKACNLPHNDTFLGL